jgi:hypothetical protein
MMIVRAPWLSMNASISLTTVRSLRTSPVSTLQSRISLGSASSAGTMPTAAFVARLIWTLEIDGGDGPAAHAALGLLLQPLEKSLTLNHSPGLLRADYRASLHLLPPFLEDIIAPRKKHSDQVSRSASGRSSKAGNEGWSVRTSA